MRSIELLQRTGVPFTVHQHEPTPCARERMRVLRESDACVVKPVLLKLTDEYLLALVPAGSRVDLSRVGATFRAPQSILATEQQLANLFPDCESGVASPFGSRYGIRTVLDRSLARQQHLLLPGNRHGETIHMLLRDFQKIEAPEIADLSSDHPVRRYVWPPSTSPPPPPRLNPRPPPAGRG